MNNPRPELVSDSGYTQSSSTDNSHYLTQRQNPNSSATFHSSTWGNEQHCPPVTNNENCVAQWINNSPNPNPITHGMRQPTHTLLKAGSGFPQEQTQLNSRILGTTNMRRTRHFVPSYQKDEYYWMKRRKNNAAARKSREKRRTNDLVLAQKVLLLLQENIRLRKDLVDVKMKYNEISLEEVSEFNRKLREGDFFSSVTQNLNLSDYSIQDGVIKAVCNGMEIKLSAQLKMPEQTEPSSVFPPISSASSKMEHPHSMWHPEPCQAFEPSSTSAFVSLPKERNGGCTEVLKSTMSPPEWNDCNDKRNQESRVFDEKAQQDNNPNPDEVLRMKSWHTDVKIEALCEAEAHLRPFVSFDSASSSSSSSSCEETVQAPSIDDAQILQNFVHMSWRKATKRSQSSSPSSDDARKGSCSNSDFSSTFSASNSQSSSPKRSSSNEELAESITGSQDEKTHRLPYKLRFKLAALQSHTD